MMTSWSAASAPPDTMAASALSQMSLGGDDLNGSTSKVYGHHQYHTPMKSVQTVTASLDAALRRAVVPDTRNKALEVSGQDWVERIAEDDDTPLQVARSALAQWSVVELPKWSKLREMCTGPTAEASLRELLTKLSAARAHNVEVLERVERAVLELESKATQWEQPLREGQLQLLAEREHRETSLRALEHKLAHLKQKNQSLIDGEKTAAKQRGTSTSSRAPTGRKNKTTAAQTGTFEKAPTIPGPASSGAPSAPSTKSSETANAPKKRRGRKPRAEIAAELEERKLQQQARAAAPPYRPAAMPKKDKPSNPSNSTGSAVEETKETTAAPVPEPAGVPAPVQPQASPTAAAVDALKTPLLFGASGSEAKSNDDVVMR